MHGKDPTIARTHMTSELTTSRGTCAQEKLSQMMISLRARRPHAALVVCGHKVNLTVQNVIIPVFFLLA